MAHEQHTTTLRAAWISIFVTLILIGAKLIGGLLSGSLALISLAAESALDLFSVLLTLIAVRITARPADKDHQYGHGKFDNISSLFQSIFLLSISVWIFYEALIRLLHPSTHVMNVDYVTFTILIGSFVLDFWRSRKLDQVGKTVRSQALQTDALHFFADSLSVVVVFIGLIFSKYFHLDGADSYAAMLVSGFIVAVSIRKGKEAVDELSDRFAHTEDAEKIRTIIKQESGIQEIDTLRMRRSGPSMFVDATVSINRVLPFASVEHILDSVKTRIQNLFAGSEVNIHPRAVRLEYESTFETIKLITSEEGILPHNIELSKDETGAVILDLHLEFPPASRFYDAHSLSEKIERHIKKHLPWISKIILHLEEERPDFAMTIVRNITSTKPQFAEELSKYLRSANPAVQNVQDLVLLESEPSQDLKLALTITLDKKLSLIQSHEIVTSVEKALRQKYPEIARIVIHSEPE